MPEITEPTITINGHVLTSAQSMTVRNAIESLAMDLRGGLGDDDHGRAMTSGYLACINEIRGMIFNGKRQTTNEPRTTTPLDLDTLRRAGREAPGLYCGTLCLQAADELEAAWRVISITRKYRDWMFGGTVTPEDKSELIQAMDAYDEAFWISTAADVPEGQHER